MSLRVRNYLQGYFAGLMVGATTWAGSHYGVAAWLGGMALTVLFIALTEPFTEV